MLFHLIHRLFPFLWIGIQFFILLPCHELPKCDVFFCYRGLKTAVDTVRHIEGNAAMLILVPIFIPVTRQMGVDDVHFGIVTVLNMSIAAVTPPLGTILFTTCSITKTDMISLIKAMVPFYCVLFSMLLIVTFVPWLSLVLPNLVFG
ncbi:TRAP transporter large permease subunit [Planctomycetota bacterium]